LPNSPLFFLDAIPSSSKKSFSQTVATSLSEDGTKRSTLQSAKQKFVQFLIKLGQLIVPSDRNKPPSSLPFKELLPFFCGEIFNLILEI